jgi:twitching motility protein PilT
MLMVVAMAKMSIISNLLEYSLKSGASDLHLSVGSTPMVRIHGEMKRLDMASLDEATMSAIANDVLSDNQKQIFEKNLEIDFSTALEDKGRFRVNFFNQLNGLSAVFRTIPSDIKSVEELGLPGVFNQLAEKEKGLILLTGPTGSGKSTTLAAN